MFTIIGGDGKEYGPVTTEQIRAWLAGGRASLETQARREGETTWSRLGNFPEFSNVAPPVIGAEGSPSATGNLAGFGARFGAALIDFALTCFCFIPAAQAAAGYMKEKGLLQPGRLNPNALDSYREAILALPGVHLAMAALLGLAIVEVLLLSMRGQTVGKLVAGIRIVSISTGTKAGFVNAFLLRGFLRTVIYFCLGWLGPLGGLLQVAFWLTNTCFIFRGDRRCLHDLIAGTRVEKVPAAS